METLAIAPIVCVECGRGWFDETERWRLKLLVEGHAAETVPYCPDCHAREFESN